MKQIVRDSSAYYLLGYNSTQAPSDGKFHEIKVQVKRPGVQVRARRGLLGADDRGRRARAGAQGRAAEGVDNALAAIVVPAAARNVDPDLDWHVARRRTARRRSRWSGSRRRGRPAIATSGARRRRG